MSRELSVVQACLFLLGTGTIDPITITQVATLAILLRGTAYLDALPTGNAMVLWFLPLVFKRTLEYHPHASRITSLLAS